MPTYDFRCKKCRKNFTVTTTIAALPRTKCPKCGGKKDLERVWQPFTAITKKKT